MRRALTVSLVLVLLASALAGTLFVGDVTANPIGMLLPHDPHARILVQSPVNHTVFDVGDVVVTFSLNLSEWAPPWPDWNPDYSFYSTVSCYLHDRCVWERTVRDSPGDHVFSVPLEGLANGVYGLTVKACTNGTYFHGIYLSDGVHWKESNVPVFDSSDVVIFTVNVGAVSLAAASSDFCFESVVIVSAAIIASSAIVSFGLVAYFVKRNRRRSR
jgi:hypothetical protein